MLFRPNRLIIQRLKAHGCYELAAKITKSPGIGVHTSGTGSLNGAHVHKACRRALAQLCRSRLKKKGFEHAQRTVDTVFAQAGVQISPDERERLAHMLNQGLL